MGKFTLGSEQSETSAKAKQWQESVYYYWWAFLRRNVDYLDTCQRDGRGKCARLFADFGDVRGPNFPKWWLNRGRELFCEPVGSGARIIEDRDLGDPDSDFRMVIEIERYGDVDRTIAELRKLLKKGSASRRSRKKVSRALYQALDAGIISSLRNRLLVLELGEEKPELTPDQIVTRLKLNIGYQQDHANWMSAARAIVRDYRSENERMIHYAGFGVFPVITADDEARVEGFLQEREVQAQERRKEIKSGLYCEPFGS
jgi:hypothetical protein